MRKPPCRRQSSKTSSASIYVLIALGFAGLIGAHEICTLAVGRKLRDLTLPFILAAAGTLCFVAAGLMARKLMKGGGSR